VPGAYTTKATTHACNEAGRRNWGKGSEMKRGGGEGMRSRTRKTVTQLRKIETLAKLGCGALLCGQKCKKVV